MLFHANYIQFPHKCCHMASPCLIHDFSVIDVGDPCSIPVTSYSLQKRLQGMRVACKPCKFEIPARQYPYKIPVKPCKHLQCKELVYCIHNDFIA